MAYTPTSSTALALQQIASQLAGLSAFATFCRTFTPADRIIIGDSGLVPGVAGTSAGGTISLVCPIAMVEVVQDDQRQVGLDSWREDDGIAIELYHAPVPTDGPSDAHLRALDEQVLIMNGFRVLIRSRQLVATAVRAVLLPSALLPTCPVGLRGSIHSRIQLDISRGIS